MVLSFFRKSGNKTPERVEAKPKVVPKATPVAPPSSVGPLSKSPGPKSKPPANPDDDWDLEFSLANTEPNGGYGVEIHEGLDTFSEVAEQAAILYANGQDEAARVTLESMIQDNNETGALKLWRMLFDLFRAQGNRAAFEALELQFTRVCELSPPAWGLAVIEDEAISNLAVGSVVLQGVLSGDDPVFEILSKALKSGESQSLELGRLAGLDNEGSGRLAKLLHQARRHHLGWVLFGATGFAERLANRTVAGQAQEEALWELLLELYQYLGWEALFEEKAVDYAVTFEVSPPSWEGGQISEAQASLLSAEAEQKEEQSCQLAGEMLQGDLKGLGQHLEKGEECYLDFSKVTRLDFASAGALVNLLSSAGAKSVVIYHPNRLVAELMRVMGVDQLAKIEISKH